MRQAAGSAEKQRMKILCVDDEPSHLKAVRRLFKNYPGELMFAASGREALDIVCESDPDLVILDINMPGMDGFEVCRQIKSNPDKNTTMVLMVSGRVELEDRLTGYRAAADDYLTKPYDPSELIAKADVLLRLKAARDDLALLNRQLEEEVRRQAVALMRKERQALIGRMVQGIAHNMRGPLTVIDGNLSIAGLLMNKLTAERGLAPNIVKTHEGLKNCLDKIDQGSRRAAKLICDLVDSGRSDGNAKVALNLNDLLRRETDFLKADPSAGHDITIRLDLAQTLPDIRGFETDFSQIVYNMVKNAADAMVRSEQRTLTITSRVSGNGDIELVFADTGSGIAPENLEKIFEPFFSTKSTQPTGDNPAGSGIGLYYCKRIAEAYDGDISVKSTSGQGTAFSIVLPPSNRSEQQTAENRPDDPA